MSSQLIKELRLLAAFRNCSIKSNRASEKFLLLAFTQPKPLFSSPDKSEAINLIEKSFPLFRESFSRLKIRLEPDLVDFAQKFCSGFQFIVDELRIEAAELQEILEGIKEYIKNCKGNQIEPEYSNEVKDLTEEEKAKIPRSHWWWFVKPLEEQSEEE